MELLTTYQIAELYHMSYYSALAYMKKKGSPAVKPGRAWVVDKEAFHKFLLEEAEKEKS